MATLRNVNISNPGRLSPSHAKLFKSALNMLEDPTYQNEVVKDQVLVHDNVDAGPDLNRVPGEVLVSGLRLEGGELLDGYASSRNGSYDIKIDSEKFLQDGTKIQESEQRSKTVHENGTESYSESNHYWQFQTSGKTILIHSADKLHFDPASQTILKFTSGQVVNGYP
jgi:hypothetical protein